MCILFYLYINITIWYTLPALKHTFICSPQFLKQIFCPIFCISQSIALSGILSSNSRVFSHPLPSKTGLLPCAHGPLHHAAGFKEGGHEETGLLPSSSGVLLALRRHHCVRLLLPGCRFVSPYLWLCFCNHIHLKTGTLTMWGITIGEVPDLSTTFKNPRMLHNNV